jgi:cardiolipin synthase
MKALHESQLDQKATAEESLTVLSDQTDTGETSGVPRESHAGSDTNVRFILNIPNTLTIIRLLAVVPLAILISRWPEKRLVTVIVFVGIWVTDILDGFIARRFNMMTQFGKLFDPFVDKVFQVVTVIMLFSIGLVPLWVPLFYVLRETFMLFASTVLLTKHRVVVYSDLLGKFSTFLFVVAVGVIYLFPTEKVSLRNYVFILPVFTSFIATIHYGVVQLRSMRAANDDDRL